MYIYTILFKFFYLIYFVLFFLRQKPRGAMIDCKLIKMNTTTK